MNSPRLLSPAIVVDANILISAVLGSATGAYLDRVAGERSLITSEAAMREASRVVGHIRPTDLPVLDVLLDLVTIVPGEDVRAADLEDAERTLRTATASKNGSEKDAHLLALAWTVLGPTPARRAWVAGAVVAIALSTLVGLLSAFGVIGRVVIG